MDHKECTSSLMHSRCYNSLVSRSNSREIASSWEPREERNFQESKMTLYNLVSFNKWNSNPLLLYCNSSSWINRKIEPGCFGRSHEYYCCYCCAVMRLITHRGIFSWKRIVAYLSLLILFSFQPENYDLVDTLMDASR